MVFSCVTNVSVMFVILHLWFCNPCMWSCAMPPPLPSGLGHGRLGWCPQLPPLQHPVKSLTSRSKSTLTEGLLDVTMIGWNLEPRIPHGAQLLKRMMNCQHSAKAQTSAVESNCKREEGQESCITVHLVYCEISVESNCKSQKCCYSRRTEPEIRTNKSSWYLHQL